MKGRAIVAFGVSLLALAGCGHADLHEVVLRPGLASTGQPPELYFGAKNVSRPFYEVALLQVVGFGDEMDLESLSRALSGRATALGCDAVIRIRVDQGYARAHAYGLCVRYTEPVSSTEPNAEPAAAPTPPSDDAGF